MPWRRSPPPSSRRRAARQSSIPPRRSTCRRPVHPPRRPPASRGCNSPPLPRPVLVETVRPSSAYVPVEADRVYETAADAVLDAEAARQTGLALHALLQHLGRVAPADRARVGEKALAALLPDLPEQHAALAAKAIRILAKPEFRRAFRAAIPCRSTVSHRCAAQWQTGAPRRAHRSVGSGKGRGAGGRLQVRCGPPGGPVGGSCVLPDAGGALCIRCKPALPGAGGSRRHLMDEFGIVDDFAFRRAPGRRFGFHHAVRLLEPMLYSSQVFGHRAHRFQPKGKLP